MTTIRDVAREANVSIRTVSRVLNNEGEISEETRQRVQEVINKLRYTPSAVARHLVGKRGYTLGVIYPCSDAHLPSRNLMGIEQQAAELGYVIQLQLVKPPLSIKQVQDVLDGLASRSVDGIVWGVWEVVPTWEKLLVERQKSLPPIVVVGSMVEGMASVSTDDYTAARRAVQYLIDQGRRKIANITGQLYLRNPLQRHRAWQDILKENNLDPLPTLSMSGGRSAQGGREAIQQLIKIHPDIDAVFATNDVMALGVMGELHRMNRKIPQDIAVMGFDNVPEASEYYPPLTTVNQPFYESGRKAVQLLHQLIEKPQSDSTNLDNQHLYLDGQLIVRESA